MQERRALSPLSGNRREPGEGEGEWAMEMEEQRVEATMEVEMMNKREEEVVTESETRRQMVEDWIRATDAPGEV